MDELANRINAVNTEMGQLLHYMGTRDREIARLTRALEIVANRSPDGGFISPAVGFAGRVLDGAEPAEALRAEMGKSRKWRRDPNQEDECKRCRWYVPDDGGGD